MADRKTELERKKAKLAAMREDKRRKEEERQRGELGGARSSSPAAPDLRQETEDILSSLGIAPSSEPSTPGASTPSSSAVPGLPSGQSPLPGPIDGSKSPRVSASPRNTRKLEFSKISQASIPPKENELYCKETQTKHESTDRGNRSWDYYVLTYDESNRDDLIDASKALADLQKMPHVGLVPATKTVDDEHKEEAPRVRELSEDEKSTVLMSEDFMRFFNRTARLVERAIYEPVGLFTDYSGADGDEERREQQKHELLKANRDFFEDRWSRYRTVTCMDWSTTFPELLVASYNSNEESPHEPDGVCLVWNIKYKKPTPEYIFHCQSPVMSTTFAKFHPNLVIGGTYSGQIVLWDSRSNKRTPVQRTPLSAAAHTHPVYSVTVAGTQNAHNLLSLSSDGKLCAWSLDMLAQPQESMELQHKQAKAVAATSFSFFANDVNNFVVGSEEGIVFTGSRHGSKAGISEAFEGHQGPITGLDTHTLMGPVDFSQLFLTSSFDWTVKLWSVRDSKPVYSFEDNSEYIYDVGWSPLHPAMFATVDGAGRLDVWNLNVDAEVPTARLQMENQVALNKCRWHSSGLHIATGDDSGRIRLFDLNEQMATPRSDEWSMFAHTIGDLRSNHAEQHDEDSSSHALR